MPGVPGAGGPVPKRSDQRRRSNGKKTTPPPVDPVDEPADPGPGPYVVLSTDREPEPAWHPIAATWFESLGRSRQSAYYEPSDWAMARVIAEAISRDLADHVLFVTKDGDPIHGTAPIRGTSLAAYLKGATALLATEGDRRRLRLELARPGGRTADPDDEAADAAVSAAAANVAG